MVTITRNPKNLEINSPTEYEKLSAAQKRTLKAWITESLEPYRAKGFYSTSTSYRIKHHFEYSRNGFYITNGQMKGAMLACGFRPKDYAHLNWSFTLSRKLDRVDFSKLPRW